MGIIPSKKDKKNPPPFEEITMLVFGIQGSGKTSFCCGDANSVTVATEPGSNYVRTRPVDTYKWDTFLDVVEDVKAGLHKDTHFCSAIVIDIVDNLSELCRDHVCATLGIAYPGEKKDFGKSWSDVAKEWKSWIAYAMRLTNIRFISHEKKETIERKNSQGLTEEIEQSVPQFSSGQGAKLLRGICDLVGHMYVNKDGRHCISFAPSAFVGAKDRIGLLKDLGEIVLPPVPEEGFAYVSHLYEEEARKRGLEIKSRKG